MVMVWSGAIPSVNRSSLSELWRYSQTPGTVELPGCFFLLHWTPISFFLRVLHPFFSRVWWPVNWVLLRLLCLRLLLVLLRLLRLRLVLLAPALPCLLSRVYNVFNCSVMPALSGIFIHFYRILQGRAILVVLIKTIKEFNFLYFTWNFILKHFLKG